MNLIRSFILLVCWPALLVVAAENETSSNTAHRRADSFFGLHFDLHPNKSDTVLGADVSEENVAKLLTRVRPDYVQYDCKGHYGYLGYPSEIGPSAPGIVKDSLAVWRKVTREYGVGLYIHFSGLWDSVAIEQHPEWAAIMADGKPSPKATSVFGPYVDERMLPQLKEATRKYDLDGVWVDGECWAAAWDYSPAALEAWKKETGHEQAPKNAKEPNWQEWKTWNRKHFERYVSHWVDELHAFNPKLQITSNWLYSALMPVPVQVKVDYLSGDYSPAKSVDQARIDARYLAQTKMPWDLMAWGFVMGKEGLNHNLKTAVQLQQEASVVLMQGGGFQIYFHPTRSGHIDETTIETAGRVADFCRPRQAVSHKSTSVPQVAVLMSSTAILQRSDAFYHTVGAYRELEGTLHALLELGYSVDVLAEHQLEGRLREFPIIVVPDFEVLANGWVEKLTDYARQGGQLLLVGEKCARQFAPVLGVHLQGEPRNQSVELATASGVVNVNGIWQDVTLDGAEAVGFRYQSRDTTKDKQIAATMVACGSGRVGAVYGPLGQRFYQQHHPYVRLFLGQLMRKMFADPAVVVDGPPCLDVALRKTADGKLCVHLLNRANTSVCDDYAVIDHVPPVGPIKLTLKVSEKPQRLEWVPDGGSIPWSWSDGKLMATIPQVGIHGVLAVVP